MASKFATVIVNITTEDGELLERFAVRVDSAVAHRFERPLRTPELLAMDLRDRIERVHDVSEL